MALSANFTSKMSRSDNQPGQPSAAYNQLPTDPSSPWFVGGGLIVIIWRDDGAFFGKNEKGDNNGLRYAQLFCVGGLENTQRLAGGRQSSARRIGIIITIKILDGDLTLCLLNGQHNHPASGLVTRVGKTQNSRTVHYI